MDPVLPFSCEFHKRTVYFLVKVDELSLEFYEYIADDSLIDKRIMT